MIHPLIRVNRFFGGSSPTASRRHSHPAGGEAIAAAFVGLLHVSFNRIRLKDKNMQQIKVLQRPLCV
ncbi:hypothetical protein CN074_16545 [Sinorhizobium medicae]|nr:hypothetical protein CN201_04650 [Sinorhizobium medicae]RVP67148.1 hypothetical protein CN074_16545 [Sinorhizobium medicae]